MAERDYFSHTGPDGNDASDRYRIFGHDTRRCGENLALEYLNPTAAPEASAQTVVDGWMDSAGHRENILMENFDEEGIGVYLRPSGAMLVTQNFY